MSTPSTPKLLTTRAPDTSDAFPSFESFALHSRVLKGVTEARYQKPTPIQAQAIPAALSGSDVLGLAQTGTGKTAAFVLPLLHHLIGGPRGRLRALVVAPTRELAEQIHVEVQKLGRATGLRSATVYGGVGMKPQAKALRGGAEIIVACPGRLLDHLEHGTGSLSELDILVLDEADQMFDMGFLPAIRKIVARVPKASQRLLFSATMPDDVRRLTETVLRNPVTVEIGHAAPAETIAHALYPVARQQKTALLKHVLRQRDTRSALVFTRTKHGAKRLAEQLDRDNFFVASLQGNLSQNKRQQALDAFRSGDVHILVATDIAARGIDVQGVSHVINYDVPLTPEAYTHRIGRTGRAERSGEALTFVTADDGRAVHAIERALGERLERVSVSDFVYEDVSVSLPNERSQAPRPPRRTQRRGSGQQGSGQQGSGQQGSGQAGSRPQKPGPRSQPQREQRGSSAQATKSTTARRGSRGRGRQQSSQQSSQQRSQERPNRSTKPSS